VSGRPWLGPLVAGLVAAAVVLLCSWPVAISPGSWLIGASQADFYGIAFGMDHLASHIMGGSWPPVHVDTMEYPAGASLVITDLPEMLLAAPITWLFGAAVAFNLLQLLHHALAAAAAWWCARVLGLQLPGQAVAALAFAFAPALVGTTFNQNPDASAWYWIPLAIGLVAGEGGWRRGLAGGACAGLAAWCSPYAGVMVAAALLVMTPRKARRRWLPALGAALVVGGAGAFVAWWSVQDPMSAVYKPGTQVALHGAAVLDGLLVPWPELHTNKDWDASHFVHDGYLGVSLVLAGIVGAVWRRRWRWLLLALAGVVLALGPLMYHGDRFEIVNPLWSLGNKLGLSRLWQYHRYGALAVLGLGFCSGALADRLGRWGWVVVAVVGLDLLVITGAWQRLGAAPVFEDSACELLAELPPGPVYDLPPGSHELWLYGVTCHRRPVNSGINRPDSRYLGTLLKHHGGEGPHQRLAVLKELGFRYLVHHPQAPNGDQPDGFIAISAACEVARGADGVVVHDLEACELELPEVGPLPKPRDRDRLDMRTPQAEPGRKHRP